MNYILNIHTTAEKAIVNISNENQVIGTSVNSEQKEHAGFLHTAIKNILDENHINIAEVKAVGVTGGPGSYTGIRVGLATAKGLSFALKIPMMMYNSLELMAFSAIENFEKDKQALFCPMIDARRMEVFSAIYDNELKEILSPAAVVLDENSFGDIPSHLPVFYFGSGAAKFKQLAEKLNTHWYYVSSDVSSGALARFGWNKFKKNDFENLVNAKPLYVKEFYTPAKNVIN